MALNKYFGAHWLERIFIFGDSGVEFFFVLSGFIIMHAHRADLFRAERLGSYISRRLVRIYPTYWIIFGAVFGGAIFSLTLRDAVPFDLATLGKSLLLLPQDPKVVGGSGAPVIIVAWSLQYEICFYALFALLIANRWLGTTAGILFLLPAAAATVVNLDGPALPFFIRFLSRGYVWLFGMGMAVAALHGARRWSLRAPLRLAAAGAFGFALIALDKVLRLDLLAHWRIMLYGVASAAMILGLARAEDSGKVLGAQRPMQLLGDSSYALYLIHFPLISLLCKVFLAVHLDRLGIPGVVMSFFLMFATCLASAAAFHRWIERPVIALLRRQTLPVSHASEARSRV
jgi:peptidoglycan/LPS O-acetylase OafA/YrhL